MNRGRTPRSWCVLGRPWVAAFALWGLTLASPAAEPEAPPPAVAAPRRIHIARGLWWQHWRLHEAAALAGGADCDASWDVFGDPHGYSGCGRALSDFPKTDEALRRYDLIVLTGIRAAALPPDAQKRLCAWVEAGGGLLVLGGVHGFGAGGWHGTPIEAILPVEIGGASDLTRSDAPLALATSPAGKAVLGADGSWGAACRVFYYHANLTPKPDAQVWVTAGDKPFLLGRQAGRGRVAACAATVCGEPASDKEQLFWQDASWPRTVAAVLKWLMPDRRLTERQAPAPGDPADPRLRELAGLAELDIDGLMAEDDGKPAGAARKGTDLLARIQKLAVPCGGVLHARAVVKALAGSGTPLGAREAESIFAAIEPYVQGDDFRAPALAMTQTGNSGQASLGMRLLGRLRSPALRAVAAPVIAKGLAGLPAQAARQGLLTLRPPDGEDDFLRLCAVRAALDSGDAGLLPALQAMPQALEAAGKIDADALAERAEKDAPLTLPRQLAVEALAARAALGDAEAAPLLVRAVIYDRLEYEAVLDSTQHAMWNVTPASLAARQRRIDSLPHRQALANRLMAAAARVPASSYPALAADAGEWTGEFAMEALLAALADRGEPLPSAALDALATLQEKTSIPEVRLVCGRRLADAGIRR